MSPGRDIAECSPEQHANAEEKGGSESSNRGKAPPPECRADEWSDDCANFTGDAQPSKERDSLRSRMFVTPPRSFRRGH